MEAPITRPGDPSLGWSRFALERLDPSRGHSRFEGSPYVLLDRVADAWSARRPGTGRADLEHVVVVPVSTEGFVGTVVRIDEDTPLRAELHRREPEEEPVVRVLARGEPEPVKFARVVLYSKHALEENGGQRTTDADWEVVAIIAGAEEDEPMHPITMARNFLERPGGTFAPYSAEQFAEAIWHWATRAKRDPTPE